MLSFTSPSTLKKYIVNWGSLSTLLVLQISSELSDDVGSLSVQAALNLLLSLIRLHSYTPTASAAPELVGV